MARTRKKNQGATHTCVKGVDIPEHVMKRMLELGVEVPKSSDEIVLNAVREWILETGEAPRPRDIDHRVDNLGSSAIRNVLLRLVSKGLVYRVDGHYIPARD